MTITPWDWQLRDVETLKEHDFIGLLNIEPGGTKTAISVLAMKEAQPEVTLIIAPESTHGSAWAPTVKELLGVEARTIGNKNKAQKEAFTDFEMGFAGVYMVTPQLFTRSDVADWYGDMLIVDEVHLLANPGKAGQTKLSGYNPKDSPVSDRFPMRLALSGTPVRNKFANAWSIMRMLWPWRNKSGDIAYINHFMWKHQRMTSAQIRTGYDRQTKKVKTATNWLYEREPGRLFNEAPCVIQHFRRRKCCEAHPEGFLSVEEPQVLRRVVELLPAQKKAIKEVEQHGITWLDDHPLVSELPITTQQRIRQLCLGVPTITWDEDDEGNQKMNVEFEPDCKSPFLDEVLAILESLDEGEPVVVYMESQRFARVTTERLIQAGYAAFEYSGQVNTKERNANLAAFGTPEGHQVLVGVISSIGTGTNGLQKVCNTEIWLESSLDTTLNEQTQARTDRIGAKGQVQRYLILDSFGYAEGRMGKQLEKRLKLRESTTRRI